jgi:sporulation protein YlmC with PRC-barrel domain
MKVAALFVLACLATAPDLHAQTSSSRLSNTMIGKPIYTSDGVKIGQVTNIGRYKGQRSMIGEVGLTLGFGTRLVLIPNDLAVVQKDRVVLTITSDRVSEMLGTDR